MVKELIKIWHCIRCSITAVLGVLTPPQNTEYMHTYLNTYLKRTIDWMEVQCVWLLGFTFKVNETFLNVNHSITGHFSDCRTTTPYHFIGWQLIVEIFRVFRTVSSTLLPVTFKNDIAQQLEWLTFKVQWCVWSQKWTWSYICRVS